MSLVTKVFISIVTAAVAATTLSGCAVKGEKPTVSKANKKVVAKSKVAKRKAHIRRATTQGSY